MAGIITFGGYLPRCRPEHADAVGEGARAMGVEAARRSRWEGACSPASIHVAAPAHPGDANATAVHAALGLGRHVFATDHAGSARSAVGAVRAAIRGEGLAVLADARADGRDPFGVPRQGGAAAFLCGTGDEVIADVVGMAAATAAMEAEATGLAYHLPLIREVAGRALQQAGLRRADHIVVACDHADSARAAARILGTRDRLEAVAGNLGAAHVWVQLVDVLERADADESILVVSAADGADALVLRTNTGLTERRPDRAGVLESGAEAEPVGREVPRGRPASGRAAIKWSPAKEVAADDR